MDQVEARQLGGTAQHDGVIEAGVPARDIVAVVQIGVAFLYLARMLSSF